MCLSGAIIAPFHPPENLYKLHTTATRTHTDMNAADQGRVDGALCDYSEQDKLNFLQRAHDKGVSISLPNLLHKHQAWRSSCLPDLPLIRCATSKWKPPCSRRSQMNSTSPRRMCAWPCSTGAVGFRVPQNFKSPSSACHVMLTRSLTVLPLPTSLNGDQVSITPEDMAEWDSYPGKVVMAYIQSSLSKVAS